MVYLPHTKQQEREMLQIIGVGSVEDLLSDIPSEIRLSQPLNLPPPLSEWEVRQELQAMAEKNADLQHYVSFLGAGAYDHFIPSAVGSLVFRSEFYTAYTPYQAELSQGVLQSIYEYQTLICQLTGMEVANASLYDGGSALAEAAMMAVRITKRNGLLVSSAVHPSHRRVVRTYLSGLGLPVMEIPWDNGTTDLSMLSRQLDGPGGKDVAAVLIQSPNFFGCIEEAGAAVDLAHRAGALAIVSADPISLGLLAPPGGLGADIVVGEGQGMGNALNLGGPYVGFLAARKEHVRQLPGRVVGASLDADGRRAFCLTLQTREQHIRRERATSNICTNQALCALVNTVYLALMGKEGLTEVGRLCVQKAHYLQQRLCGIQGFEPAFTAPFFKEFVVKTPRRPSQLNKRLLKDRIVGGLELDGHVKGLKNHYLLCVTEKRSRAEMDRFVEAVT
jgi:glycine dehydrogenase subunit 1